MVFRRRCFVPDFGLNCLRPCGIRVPGRQVLVLQHPVENIGEREAALALAHTVPKGDVDVLERVAFELLSHDDKPSSAGPTARAVRWRRRLPNGGASDRRICSGRVRPLKFLQRPTRRRKWQRKNDGAAKRVKVTQTGSVAVLQFLRVRRHQLVFRRAH